MHKVSVTINFDCLADAQDALDKLTQRPRFIPQSESPAGAAEVVTATSTPPQVAAPAVSGEKPARKPRSDAGKPRGSYGKRDAEQQQQQQPDNAEDLRAEKAAQSAAAPAQAITPTPESVTPPAAAPSGKLTIADARAALDRINVTPGLGMPACIAHINSFGYARISDVPAEKYAEFIAQADAKVAAAGKK